MKSFFKFVCVFNIILFSILLFLFLIGMTNINTFYTCLCCSIFSSIVIIFNAFCLKKLRQNKEFFPKKEIKNHDNKREKYTGAKEINIDYVDSFGKFTNRDITIQYIYKENDIYYIRAFCHLRGEERTFKVQSINKMYIYGAEISEPELYFQEKLE